MRFVHRIGFRASGSQRREMANLGLKLPVGIVMPGGGDPLLAFDVDEDHPSWLTVRELFRRWGVSDVLRTEFSKAEMAAAEWLKLGAEHHGYPQPDEGTFGYLQVTYDLTDWCARCGVGKRQKAPFQMKREPRWGKRDIFQLNWVFDEHFVTPEVWATVFKPHGIDCREVTNTQAIELRTVVQLVANDEIGVISEGLSAERCESCARVKYPPVSRGIFPALTTKPEAAMVKSSEYFGTGASAHRAVLISRDLARALWANKIRGASLWPVARLVALFNGETR